jgi:hypothetical protein
LRLANKSSEDQGLGRSLLMLSAWTTALETEDLDDRRGDWRMLSVEVGDFYV